MKNNEIKIFSKLSSILVVLILFILFVPLNSYATGTAGAVTDPVIVVSLGDSYSSGEGITPFYGQDKSISEKVKDEDWLAHRSQKSWASQLVIPGIDGTLGNYNVNSGTLSENCQWYFAAVSGAETTHIATTEQPKKYYKKNGFGKQDDIKDSKNLPKQVDVITNNNLQGIVDYVTVTIGGNDVGFEDIIYTAATGCSYLHFGATSKLEDTLDTTWKNISKTEKKIRAAYESIQEAAGEQAEIIVVGYPKLLDKRGNAIFDKNEAKLINRKVTDFNKKIEAIVNECRASGMNIHFVDVETEFDKDGGHQAYSPVPWIIGIKPRQKEDINDGKLFSCYCIHPNELGAQAYARCVNAKIKEIDAVKFPGTLSGKICKASDYITAIPGATITAKDADGVSYVAVSNANGNYTLSLPAGKYFVSITADGYIDFNAYATVVRNQNTYMETFLLVEGSDAETGIASGRVFNSLTGIGTPGVTLTIKKNWNSAEEASEIVKNIIADDNGDYSVELPLGNYTIVATKDGFTSSSFNIIVQEGHTPNQDGTITPEIFGNDYLITLTWDEHPRDVDAHMVGYMQDGRNFHVYYSTKTARSNSETICALDYDDQNSYGPEHITLHADTDGSYYYYLHKYKGNGSLSSSGAKVTIEQGNHLIATFHIPTDLGNSDYWNVFCIKNGKVIVANTITSTPNTYYAD